MYFLVVAAIPQGNAGTQCYLAQSRRGTIPKEHHINRLSPGKGAALEMPHGGTPEADLLCQSINVCRYDGFDAGVGVEVAVRAPGLAEGDVDV